MMATLDIFKEIAAFRKKIQMFLKISQKSQENNCVGVSFNKASDWRLATLFKERFRRRFFSCGC